MHFNKKICFLVPFPNPPHGFRFLIRVVVNRPPLLQRVSLVTHGVVREAPPRHGLPRARRLQPRQVMRRHVAAHAEIESKV